MENVQALRGTEFEPSLKLLELFAYGTYSDYTKDPSAFPELSKKMILKLQQLSIVSLAHRSKKVPYAALQEELGIANVRELEDTVIDAVYAGLVDGRLNQAKAVLNIKSAIARDVRPEDVAAMAVKLRAWGETVRSHMAAVEASMGAARAARAAEAAAQEAYAKEVAEAKEAVAKRMGAGGDEVDGDAAMMGGFGLPAQRAPRAGPSAAARSRRGWDGHGGRK